jgi:hypothetical protein
MTGGWVGQQVGGWVGGCDRPLHHVRFAPLHIWKGQLPNGWAVADVHYQGHTLHICNMQHNTNQLVLDCCKCTEYALHNEHWL